MSNPHPSSFVRRLSSARIRLSLALLLVASLALSACDDTPPDKNPTGLTPTVQAPRKPGEYPPILPTATVPTKSSTQPGRYDNTELGITLTYPSNWEAQPNSDSGSSSLLELTSPFNEIVVGLFYSPMPSDIMLEEASKEVVDGFSSGLDNVKQLGDEAFTIGEGREARMSVFTGNIKSDGAPLRVVMVSSARGGRLFSLWASVDPDNPQSSRQTVESLFKGMSLTAPELYGIQRDQALFLAGVSRTTCVITTPPPAVAITSCSAASSCSTLSLRSRPTWLNHGRSARTARSILSISERTHASTTGVPSPQETWFTLGSAPPTQLTTPI